MRKHDRLISLKLPSNLLQAIAQKASEHRMTRSMFIRRAVEKAIRDEIVENQQQAR